MEFLTKQFLKIFLGLYTLITIFTFGIRPRIFMILQLNYSKQQTSRLENLLMIVPAIALVLANLLLKSADLDTHYPNTYFSFSFGNVSFFSWALLIVPFILHLFLKQQNVGNQSFISLHIILSLVLLVTVLFTYQVYTPTNAVTSNSIWGIPLQRQWMEATFTTYVFIVAQFALQVIFSIYALIKLLP
jgi:hypothetical protein